jgi:hypothetical protein
MHEQDKQECTEKTAAKQAIPGSGHVAGGTMLCVTMSSQWSLVSWKCMKVRVECKGGPRILLRGSKDNVARSVIVHWARMCLCVAAARSLVS